MKKYFIVFVLFISVIKVTANPLPDPTPYINISELQFRADSSWILEIAIYSEEAIEVTDIFVKSNSGESKIEHLVYNINDHYSLIVVESNNLISPLFINPLQDSVSIRGLCMWGSGIVNGDLLVYGYPNSKIRTPRVGQSIATCSYYGFSITKSPSIGLSNDTTGMMGTIKGMIYDLEGLPLMNKSDVKFFFNYYGSSFYPNSDASYSVRYFSNDFIAVNYLSYFNGTGQQGIKLTTPINFSMQPDSIVFCDIYLSDSILIMGLNEIKKNSESVLKIYPQPIYGQTFNYEIAIPIKALETYMIFRNINGQEIYRFLVTDNIGEVALPKNLTSGIYNVELFSNKKIYTTAKIIIQ